MRKQILKIISIVVATSFLFQGVGWTVPISQPSAISHQPLGDIYIPEQYGRIEGVMGGALRQSRGRENRSTVILIKDAHCHYEAQRNIAKILDILIKDYGVDLVGIEGAGGKVDPSVIAGSPDAKRRKEVADKYLKKGWLTASEALAMEKGKDYGFSIWGVEDLRLYLNDLKAFRDVYSGSGVAERFIEIAENLISSLKNKLYAEDVLDFDKKIKEYKENKLPLTELIKYLYSIDKAGFTKYPNLQLVLKAILLEEAIDFDKTEKERTALIRECEKRLPQEELGQLVQKSLLYKLGKISSLEYYKYLEPLIISCQPKAVNLRKYARLTKLHSRIDENRLFGEIDALIENIYRRYIADETAWKLHAIDKKIYLLRKLNRLEITRGELDECRQSGLTINNIKEFLEIQGGINNITIPNELNDESFLNEVGDFYRYPDEFYKYALERDGAIIENLITRMGEENKDRAVLIVGGFHADGAERLLNKKGVQVITITPSITKENPDAKRIYLDRMMDTRIQPEKMLSEIGANSLAAAVETGVECPWWKQYKINVERIENESLKGIIKSSRSAEEAAEKIRVLTEDERRKVIDDFLDIIHGQACEEVVRSILLKVRAEGTAGVPADYDFSGLEWYFVWDEYLRAERGTPGEEGYTIVMYYPRLEIYKIFITERSRNGELAQNYYEYDARNNNFSTYHGSPDGSSKPDRISGDYAKIQTGINMIKERYGIIPRAKPIGYPEIDALIKGIIVRKKTKAKDVREGDLLLVKDSLDEYRLVQVDKIHRYRNEAGKSIIGVYQKGGQRFTEIPLVICANYTFKGKKWSRKCLEVRTDFTTRPFPDHEYYVDGLTEEAKIWKISQAEADTIYSFRPLVKSPLEDTPRDRAKTCVRIALYAMQFSRWLKDEIDMESRGSKKAKAEIRESCKDINRENYFAALDNIILRFGIEIFEDVVKFLFKYNLDRLHIDIISPTPYGPHSDGYIFGPHLCKLAHDVIRGAHPTPINMDVGNVSNSKTLFGDEDFWMYLRERHPDLCQRLIAYLKGFPSSYQRPTDKSVIICPTSLIKVYFPNAYRIIHSVEPNFAPPRRKGPPAVTIRSTGVDRPDNIGKGRAKSRKPEHILSSFAGMGILLYSINAWSLSKGVSTAMLSLDTINLIMIGVILCVIVFALFADDIFGKGDSRKIGTSLGEIRERLRHLMGDEVSSLDENNARFEPINVGQIDTIYAYTNLEPYICDKESPWDVFMTEDSVDQYYEEEGKKIRKIKPGDILRIRIFHTIGSPIDSLLRVRSITRESTNLFGGSVKVTVECEGDGVFSKGFSLEYGCMNQDNHVYMKPTIYAPGIGRVDTQYRLFIERLAKSSPDVDTKNTAGSNAIGHLSWVGIIVSGIVAFFSFEKMLYAADIVQHAGVLGFDPFIPLIGLLVLFSILVIMEIAASSSIDDPYADAEKKTSENLSGDTVNLLMELVKRKMESGSPEGILDRKFLARIINNEKDNAANAFRVLIKLVEAGLVTGKNIKKVKKLFIKLTKTRYKGSKYAALIALVEVKVINEDNVDTMFSLLLKISKIKYYGNKIYEAISFTANAVKGMDEGIRNAILDLSLLIRITKLPNTASKFRAYEDLASIVRNAEGRDLITGGWLDQDMIFAIVHETMVDEEKSSDIYHRFTPILIRTLKLLLDSGTIGKDNIKQVMDILVKYDTAKITAMQELVAKRAVTRDNLWDVLNYLSETEADAGYICRILGESAKAHLITAPDDCNRLINLFKKVLSVKEKYIWSAYLLCLLYSGKTCDEIGGVFQGDNISVEGILEELAQMAHIYYTENKEKKGTEVIKNNLDLIIENIYALVLFYKSSKSVFRDIDAFSRILRKIIINARIKDVLYETGRANDDFEYESTVMESSSLRHIIMISVHEIMHNILNNEGFSGIEINERSIHEFLSDVAAFAVIVGVGDKEGINEYSEILKFTALLAKMEEHDFKRQEEHQTARTMLQRIFDFIKEINTERARNGKEGISLESHWNDILIIGNNIVHKMTGSECCEFDEFINDLIGGLIGLLNGIQSSTGQRARDYDGGSETDVPELGPFRDHFITLIGKVYKDLRVVKREGKILKLRGFNTRTGKMETLDLKIEPLAKMPQEMEDILSTLEDGNRKLVETIFSLAPEMYRYKQLYEDLFGFASTGDSAEHNLIALHESLANVPIALFHEVGEYLLDMRIISLELAGNELIIYINGKQFGSPILLEEDAMRQAKKAEKYPDKKNHYLLRALQRQVFGEMDKELTSRIKLGQQIENQARLLPLDASIKKIGEAFGLEEKDIENPDIRRKLGEISGLGEDVLEAIQIIIKVMGAAYARSSILTSNEPKKQIIRSLGIACVEDKSVEDRARYILNKLFPKPKRKEEEARDLVTLEEWRKKNGKTLEDILDCLSPEKIGFFSNADIEYTRDKLEEVVRKLGLQPGQRYLHVGASCSRVVILLALYGIECTYLDMSPQTLVPLREELKHTFKELRIEYNPENPPVRFVQCNIASADSTLGPFDVITMFHVFLQFKGNLESAIKNLLMLIKDGGTIWFTPKTDLSTFGSIEYELRDLVSEFRKVPGITLEGPAGEGIKGSYPEPDNEEVNPFEGYNLPYRVTKRPRLVEAVGAEKRDEASAKRGQESSSRPSISSTGVGDESEANWNILVGILDISLKQGKIEPEERDARLFDFLLTDGMTSVYEDIELDIDNENVFLIDGHKVIVIDTAEILSTTEEGEQYVSAGLRRGTVYITRSKYDALSPEELLKIIQHEIDEVNFLREEAQRRGWTLEQMSRFLKDPENMEQARELLQNAHEAAVDESREQEGKVAHGILQRLRNFDNEHPWLKVIFIVVAIIGILLVERLTKRDEGSASLYGRGVISDVSGEDVEKRVASYNPSRPRIPSGGDDWTSNVDFYGVSLSSGKKAMFSYAYDNSIKDKGFAQDSPIGLDMPEDSQPIDTFFVKLHNVKPLEKGERLSLPKLPNGRNVSFSENFEIDPYTGDLIASKDIPGGDLTYAIEVYEDNGDIKSNQKVSGDLEGEFNDIPLHPGIKEGLDEARDGSDKEKLSKLESIMEEYFRYNKSQVVGIGDEHKTWGEFLGDVLQEYGVFISDCDVLTMYAFIFSRYMGMQAVVEHGYNNDDGDTSLTYKERHARLVLKIDGKWEVFDPSSEVDRATKEELEKVETVDGLEIDDILETVPDIIKIYGNEVINRPYILAVLPLLLFLLRKGVRSVHLSKTISRIKDYHPHLLKTILPVILAKVAKEEFPGNIKLEDIENLIQKIRSGMSMENLDEESRRLIEVISSAVGIKDAYSMKPDKFLDILESIKSKLSSRVKDVHPSKPSISSTGVGDETEANRNILIGILNIALKQGKITEGEYNSRLNGEDSSFNDIELEVDNQNVFDISGHRVIVIDTAELLSTTEEGEQYVSAGLRRGTVYITRSKFDTLSPEELRRTVQHEVDEVNFLRQEAQRRGLTLEQMSEFLKNPANAKDAKWLIQAAHGYAEKTVITRSLITDLNKFVRELSKEEFEKLIQIVEENPAEISDFYENFNNHIREVLGNIDANMLGNIANKLHEKYGWKEEKCKLLVYAFLVLIAYIEDQGIAKESDDVMESATNYYTKPIYPDGFAGIRILRNYTVQGTGYYSDPGEDFSDMSIGEMFFKIESDGIRLCIRWIKADIILPEEEIKTSIDELKIEESELLYNLNFFDDFAELQEIRDVYQVGRPHTPQFIGKWKAVGDLAVEEECLVGTLTGIGEYEGRIVRMVTWSQYQKAFAERRDNEEITVVEAKEVDTTEVRNKIGQITNRTKIDKGQEVFAAIVNNIPSHIYSISPNPYIQGSGSELAVFLDKNFLDSFISNSDLVGFIALFHELGHVWIDGSNERTEQIISVLEPKWKRWYEEKVRQYGNEMRAHYALRAFQRQAFGQMDMRLTQKIKDRRCRIIWPSPEHRDIKIEWMLKSIRFYRKAPRRIFIVIQPDEEIISAHAYGGAYIVMQKYIKRLKRLDNRVEIGDGVMLLTPHFFGLSDSDKKDILTHELSHLVYWGSPEIEEERTAFLEQIRGTVIEEIGFPYVDLNVNRSLIADGYIAEAKTDIDFQLRHRVKDFSARRGMVDSLKAAQSFFTDYLTAVLPFKLNGLEEDAGRYLSELEGFYSRFISRDILRSIVDVIDDKLVPLLTHGEAYPDMNFLIDLCTELGMMVLLQGGMSEGPFSAAAWAHAPGVVPANLIEGAYLGDAMADRITPDEFNALVEQASERVIGKQGGDRITLELKGQSFEFTIRRIMDKTFLIPNNIDRLTERQFRSALSSALTQKDLQGLSTDVPYLILSVKHFLRTDILNGPLTDHLFGNCVSDHIILIHETFPEICVRLNSQLQNSGDILLQVGLEHELRHEATGRHGYEIEKEFARRDVRRFVELAGERGVDMPRLGSVLSGCGVIEDSFVSELKLSMDLQNQVKRLGGLPTVGVLTAWSPGWFGSRVRVVAQDDTLSFLEKLIIKLASSIQTYNNPDNRYLYRVVAEHLGIEGGIALDVDSGSNNLPAEGLIEAGLGSVVRVDSNRVQLGEEGMVSEGIEKRYGNATNLPFEDNSCVAVVHNQSLSLIGEYLLVSDIGREILRERRDLEEEFERTSVVPEELSYLAVRHALEESYRVLKHGGWILIKPGGHLSDIRDIEGPRLGNLLEQVGFEDIVVFTMKGASAETIEVGSEMSMPKNIPVFMYARKPLHRKVTGAGQATSSAGEPPAEQNEIKKLSELLGLEKKEVAKALKGDSLRLLHTLRELLTADVTSEDELRDRLQVILESAEKAVRILNMAKDDLPEHIRANLSKIQETLAMYIAIKVLKDRDKKKEESRKDESMPCFMKDLKGKLMKKGLDEGFVNDVIKEIERLEGFYIDESGDVMPSPYFEIMLSTLLTMMPDAKGELETLWKYKRAKVEVRIEYRVGRGSAQGVEPDVVASIVSTCLRKGSITEGMEEEFVEVIARYKAEKEEFLKMFDDQKKKLVEKGIDNILGRSRRDILKGEIMVAIEPLSDGENLEGGVISSAIKGLEKLRSRLESELPPTEAQIDEKIPVVIDASLLVGDLKKEDRKYTFEAYGEAILGDLRAMAGRGTLRILYTNDEQKEAVELWLKSKGITEEVFIRVDGAVRELAHGAVWMLSPEMAKGISKQIPEDKMPMHRIVKGKEEPIDNDLILMTRIMRILQTETEEIETNLRKLYERYYLLGGFSEEEIKGIIEKALVGIREGGLIVIELPPALPIMKVFMLMLQNERETIVVSV